MAQKARVHWSSFSCLWYPVWSESVHLPRNNSHNRTIEATQPNPGLCVSKSSYISSFSSNSVSLNTLATVWYHPCMASPGSSSGCLENPHLFQALFKKLGNCRVGTIETASQRRPLTQVGTVVCHELQFAYQFYCYPENEKHCNNEKPRERPCRLLVGPPTFWGKLPCFS